MNGAPADDDGLALERLLSAISHALRGPLNGIQNWNAVLDGQLGADAAPLARRALDGIRQGVERQVQLLDALSDAARVLAGRVELERAELDLAALVRAALDAAQTEAQARRVTLDFDCRIASPDATVRGAAPRLRQIVAQLLSNALRVAPPDSAVRCELDLQDAWLCLRVRDQGTGIAPERLIRLFDGHAPPDRAHRTGLGLGLPVAHRLARLHGGTLEAHSDGEGRGACFTLRLPALRRAD